jgi:hypothetical protein
LAAVYSKSKENGRVPVTLCRCRDVVKPKGFVPGMVRLVGDVGTVSIDTRLEKKRLERLETTKNILELEEER